MWRRIHSASPIQAVMLWLYSVRVTVCDHTHSHSVLLYQDIMLLYLDYIVNKYLVLQVWSPHPYHLPTLTEPL